MESRPYRLVSVETMCSEEKSVEAILPLIRDFLERIRGKEAKKNGLETRNNEKECNLFVYVD